MGNLHKDILKGKSILFLICIKSLWNQLKMTEIAITFSIHFVGYETSTFSHTKSMNAG